MKKIAVYARKGGVGKSTLAFTLACYAALMNIRTLLLAVDPQGDSARWAGGGDRRLRRDDVFETAWGFHALYSPSRVPGVPTDQFDLRIADLPPQAEAVRYLEPDLWLSPQDGRSSVIDTIPVLDAMREQGGSILFVMNRAEAAGQRAVKMVHEALEQVPDTFVWDEVIPDSGALARVAETSLPPWEVPYGRGSSGSEAVIALCRWILGPEALDLSAPRR